MDHIVEDEHISLIVAEGCLRESYSETVEVILIYEIICCQLQEKLRCLVLYKTNLLGPVIVSVID